MSLLDAKQQKIRANYRVIGTKQAYSNATLFVIGAKRCMIGVNNKKIGANQYVISTNQTQISSNQTHIGATFLSSNVNRGLLGAKYRKLNAK